MSNDEEFRVFMSYSHNDRHIAGEIKKQLEAFGISVFLAHEDIAPSVIWQEEIIEQLKKCHVFLPLLSTNFRESKWTDQEAGIAYGHNKEIIPICLDKTTPYGFMSKYQGFICTSNASRTSKVILDTILSKPIGSILKQKMIEKYLESYSFLDAASSSQILYDNMPYDEKQINTIIYGILTNGQIYGSFDGRRTVTTIINRHREIADPVLLNYFETLRSSDWNNHIFIEVWGNSLEDLIIDYIISKIPEYDVALVFNLMHKEMENAEEMNNYEALYRVMKNHGIL